MNRARLIPLVMIAASAVMTACGGTTDEATKEAPQAVSPTTTTTAALMPAKSIAPFTGTASCSDAKGDKRFPNDSADIVSVALTAEADALVIKFQLVAEPSASSSEIEWRVEAFKAIPETDMRYTQYFIVTRAGDGSFTASAIEHGVGDRSTGRGTAAIENGALVARFPWASIGDIEPPSLAPPFKWAALTAGGTINGDYCPDRKTALVDSDETKAFPG